MNNGVPNNNQVNNSNDMPVLKPMEGVTIAPVQEGPVDASNSATATSTAATVSSGAMKSNINPNNTTPVIANSTPVGQVVAPQLVVAPPQPAIQNNNAILTNSTPVGPPPVVVPPINNQVPSTDGKKKKVNIVPILILIILVLGGYTIYSSKSHKEQLANLSYNCTPVTASKEEVKLDLDSTLVKDLYSKVSTSIREDIANPVFDDNMKLYLAYRQILETDKYDTNCNLFVKTAMEPYTCMVSTTFVPKAFKEETMLEAIKKLYGEKTTIPLKNIQLGSSCIGGYQYIPKRGEFVQGYCNQNVATSYSVTKTIKEAVSTRNTIIITEEVKYHEAEKMTLPDSLKSGYYYYTFRLDMNYNYVFVSKTYKSKY